MWPMATFLCTPVTAFVLSVLTKPVFGSFSASDFDCYGSLDCPEPTRSVRTGYDLCCKPLIHGPGGCVHFAAVHRTARGASARGSGHRRSTKRTHSTGLGIRKRRLELYNQSSRRRAE